MTVKSGGARFLSVGIAISMSVSLISACSSTSSTSTDSGHSASPSAAAIESTDGHLIPITSDNVTRAGYDSATRTMTVEFRSGGVYEYSPVPATVWEAFVAAQPHPWSAVGYPELVVAGVPYRRIR